MAITPRITVEVPVLGVGNGPADYQALGRYVDALRRPEGLHLTLLHIGILADFAQDVERWTRSVTSAAAATRRTVAWLEGLPVLEPFSARTDTLIRLGGGNVAGLEVAVPGVVHAYQVHLVEALHMLLDELLVDNIDDFILGSRALGFRYPRWTPHIAIGRPKRGTAGGTLQIAPLEIGCGGSRIRNRRYLPAQEPG
jgi:hypothetical protein